MKFTLLAAAAVLAAPTAFAQSATVASTATVAVPAVPAAAVAIAAPPVEQPIPGAVIAQEQVLIAPVAVVGSNDTAVMGAAAVPVTRYWFNVPADVNEREDFRRWRGLL